MREPLIGVTCYLEETVDCEKKFTSSPLYISYPQYDIRLAEAGAVPVNLPLLNEEENFARDYAEKLDALLICGGEDVHPERYQEKAEGDFRYVPARDKFEFSLLKEFLKQKKPILGICRGLQVINVYFGGTLIQDISSASDQYIVHTRSDAASEGVHEVTMSGKWAKLLGSHCRVNSMHHQAVKKLGKGLSVVGVAEDGIIEAIQAEEYPYLFAVQWHPEMLLPVQKSIFGTFVSAADVLKKR